MTERISGFDWDQGNRTKCERHGVSIADIEALFERIVLVLPDVATRRARSASGRLDAPKQADTYSWCSPYASVVVSVSSGRSALDTCTAGKFDILKKKIPTFSTDEEAEAFVESADLSEYDLSQFKPVRFEFDRKTARVNMRLPEPLLSAVKERAKARGIPYQRFIREALEIAVTRSGRAERG
jgi:predicted DNA binding CopG/RHH family protein